MERARARVADEWSTMRAEVAARHMAAGLVVGFMNGLLGVSGTPIVMSALLESRTPNASHAAHLGAVRTGRYGGRSETIGRPRRAACTPSLILPSARHVAPVARCAPAGYLSLFTDCTQHQASAERACSLAVLAEQHRLARRPAVTYRRTVQLLRPHDGRYAHLLLVPLAR